MSENQNKTITVTSPLLPDLNEFNQLLQQIWDKKWITNNGTFHQQLESALAEYFTPCLWPEFTNEEFYHAIVDYQGRERRFGKTSEQI